jgi:integral membrane sensor domain MASE1
MRARNPSLSTIVWALTVGIAYFALSRASLELINRETGLTTVWPAAGLGLAALVVAPRHRWAALTAAMLVAGFTAQLLVGDTSAAALAISVLAPAQALAAALVMVHLVRGRPRIGSMDTVGALIVAGVGVTAVFALPGAGLLHFADTTTSSLLASWVAWWMANAVGVLVVTPAVLAFVEPDPDRASPWETAGLLGLTGGVALLLFWHHPGTGPLALRFAYPILPLLLWCTVRIGARATTFASALVAMIAALATSRGLGPFGGASLDAHQRVQILQSFLTMAVL